MVSHLIRWCLICCVVGLCAASLSAHEDLDDNYAPRPSCLIRPHQTAQKANRLQYDSTNGNGLQMQDTLRTAGGHFLLHFDRTGPQAVSPVDINANGIPDYIDSVAFYAEQVYQVEVSSMGYRAPLLSGQATAWDIYIAQIGAAPGFKVDGTLYMGYYGFTMSVNAMPQPCDINKNISSAYLVIDNDFSPTDSIRVDTTMRRVYRETGISALKITLAHEFHHMVQYAYELDYQSINFYEMTSVWMEHRVFPESTDYLQYLRPLMANTEVRYLTDIENGRNAGYAHAFFFQYLQEHVDEIVVRRMWELLASCVKNPYSALDSALALQGSNLPATWSRFMTCVYRTNSRATDPKVCLSNASSMPLLQAENQDYFVYSDPSFMLNFSLYPYQFKLIRCTMPHDSQHASDTVDIMCTSVNTAAAARGDREFNDCVFTVSKTASSGFQRLGTTEYYYSLSSSNSGVFYDTLFLNGGLAVSQAKSAFPQPFSLQTDTYMNFPVSETIPTDVDVNLSVTTTEGTIVMSETRPVVADPELKLRYVRWSTIPAHLSPGVYLYSVSYKGSDQVGKFMVKP